MLMVLYDVFNNLLANVRMSENVLILFNVSPSVFAIIVTLKHRCAPVTSPGWYTKLSFTAK